MVKRDGAHMFDQLKLPPHIQPFLAQPPVTVSELAKVVGCTVPVLVSRLRLDPSTSPAEKIFPLSTTWRMGFAHSSAVCQATSVVTCLAAGLQSQQFLDDSHPTPCGTTTAVAVATDDIIVLTEEDKAVCETIGRKLDTAMESNSIRRNAAKDVNGELNATAIGFDLTDGRCLSPAVGKHVRFLEYVDVLLDHPTCTPDELARLLGFPHWAFQLVRPLYAVFSEVYRITALPERCCTVSLPDPVLAELVCGSFFVTVVRVLFSKVLE